MEVENIISAITQNLTVSPTAVALYTNPSWQYQFEQELKEMREKYGNKWPTLYELPVKLINYVPGAGIPTPPDLGPRLSTGYAWATYMKDAIVITLTDGKNYIARYIDIFPERLKFWQRASHPSAPVKVPRDGYYPKTPEDAYIIFSQFVFPLLRSPVVSRIKTCYFTDPEIIQYPSLDRQTFYAIHSSALTQITAPPPTPPALPSAPSTSLSLPTTLAAMTQKYWPYLLAGAAALVLLMVLLAKRD